MSYKRIINVQTDMVEERRADMEQLVNETAQAQGSANIQEMAKAIKLECENRYGGNWHCHIGPCFGSSFPYEPNTYFYAEFDDLCVLVYKFL